MNFRQWIESTAVDIGSGIGTIDTTDDNDDNDDGWDWESVHNRYGRQILQWFNQGDVKKLKSVVNYHVFNEKDNDEPKSVQVNVNHIGVQGAYGAIDVEWKLKDFDPVEAEIKQNLLNSDLWKFMGIPQNQAYTTMDRGDFLEFMVYLEFHTRSNNREGSARTFRITKYYKDESGKTPEQDLTDNFTERYKERFGKNPEFKMRITSTESKFYKKLWDYLSCGGTQHYAFDVIR